MLLVRECCRKITQCMQFKVMPRTSGANEVRGCIYYGMSEALCYVLMLRTVSLVSRGRAAAA